MWRSFCVLPLLLVFCADAATEQEQPQERPLLVGTRHVPPFAMKEQDGSWSGIGIELWKQIADGLGRSYEFRDMSLEDLLASLSDKSVDVVVAALTTTVEREESFDFSQPFFVSGLGIAVVPDKSNVLTGLLKRVLSPAFLKALSALVALLLLVGVLIWIARAHQHAFPIDKQPAFRHR